MFDRQSMESMVSSMITWARGVTTKLTDFRVGSRIRTVMEAVALVLEEQTDKLYRSIKELIETNIYAVFGFDKLPATYATGIATFSRATPADQTYYIPAGTAVMSQASQYNAPIKFYTVADAIIATGSLSVDVSVICSIAGSAGRIDVNTLTTFVQKPVGVDSVNNNAAFTTGLDAETPEAQKARFQEFIQAQSRGVLQAVEYGAKLATVTDANGVITEQVLLAKAQEDLVNKLGQIDLYVWNGVGALSSNLITAINNQLTGYYDANGNPVYGYKPAGILVNVNAVTAKNVMIKLTVTPETWSTLADVQPSILSEVNRYFAGLQLGQTVVQTAIEASIKYISGVYDVKVLLSSDGGTTYSNNNITVGTTQIAVAQLPIIYQ